MEEMMMAIMVRSPPVNDQSISAKQHITTGTTTTTTSTCPITWKLYENPFYYYSKPQPQPQPQPQRELVEQIVNNQKQQQQQLHRIHLPISTRKISASFWDLSFIKPLMESEMDNARAQIIELKAELEFERKCRKKLECTNKKLSRELCEERRGREALESVCEELAKEVSSDKAIINGMKREMEEERKMLRMAEVLREERVQMKLTDAKFLLEEKLLELEEFTKQIDQQSASAKPTPSNIAADHHTFSVQSITTTSRCCVLGEKRSANCNATTTSTDNNNIGGVGVVNSISNQSRASPPEQPENPHIKRGIKGFVEFPRVVRAIGSKRKHLGTKLECQKSQLRILLKQKTPFRSNNLIMS